MACEIVEGNTINCRDSVGGVKEIYIANFSNVNSTTTTSGVCTDISMAASDKFYTFQVAKENATYTNNPITSVENGSLFWESTLTFTMKKMSASQKNSVKVLAQSRLMIIVLDNNGVYWLMGETRGVDLTEGSIASGQAFGDLSGSTITFTGKEVAFDPSFTGSISGITD